jgi:hypothetical protein
MSGGYQLSLLTPAELRQRARFVLYLDEDGAPPPPSQLSINGNWPVRTSDFSSRLAAHIEATTGGALSSQVLIQFTLKLLARREIVVAINLEPVLALFNDEDRASLWKRMFSEIIDVPGILIATLKTQSLLTPPRQVAETWYFLLRGELGPLACDDRYRRGSPEAIY